MVSRYAEARQLLSPPAEKDSGQVDRLFKHISTTGVQGGFPAAPATHI
ncbi:hypothetical protein ACH4T9_25035 [Micromonospora sp. NPDC020750]